MLQVNVLMQSAGLKTFRASLNNEQSSFRMWWNKSLHHEWSEPVWCLYEECFQQIIKSMSQILKAVHRVKKKKKSKIQQHGVPCKVTIQVRWEIIVKLYMWAFFLLKCHTGFAAHTFSWSWRKKCLACPRLPTPGLGQCKACGLRKQTKVSLQVK